jgi:hypothetical protein
MFTVELTDVELMFCKMTAGLRTITARAANVKDARMGDLSGLQMDEDGMIGEYAFCKKMNIFPDLIPGPRSGSHDCVFLGKRIDVKSTRHEDGRLLATLKNNDDVDVYVLAVIIGNKVRFPGFSLKKELCLEKNKVSLGHGIGYGVTQDRLRPWKEEYCD